MQTYQTADHPTFQDALNALCTFPEFEHNLPQSVALAVAGPVKDNVCEMTNLAWIIDGNHLTQKYGVRCWPALQLSWLPARRLSSSAASALLQAQPVAH